jgi:hypothetical protein
MNIHQQALQKFGLEARIAKLREESLELALACERYLSSDGPLEAVIAEGADVEVVSESVRQHDMGAWLGAVVEGERKLRMALALHKEESFCELIHEAIYDKLEAYVVEKLSSCEQAVFSCDVSNISTPHGIIFGTSQKALAEFKQLHIGELTFEEKKLSIEGFKGKYAVVGLKN